MHVLLAILRALLRIPRPRMERNDALALAMEEAESKGITVGDPRVVEHLRVWEIWLDRNTKGSPVIVIDQLDGTVKEVRMLSR